MREASFTLPTIDNAGNDRTADHRRLEAALALQFGGATIVDACGLWRNSSGEVCKEPGRRYSVAVGPQAEPLLLALARSYAWAMGQQALYWQASNGRISIIEREQERIAA